MFKFFSLLFGMILCAQVASADVWVVTQQWTPELETAYQAWVKSFAQVDMYSSPTKLDGNPNPYFGLTADCADTVYSMRIIFSYENGLPWAINKPDPQQPGVITGQLITQKIKLFDHIADPAEKIRQFLQWVFDITDTHTLPNDTYSISMSAVTPGSILETTHKNHHSWTIADITPTGNPRLIFNSTAGREKGSQAQERNSWPNPLWVFEPEDGIVDPNDPMATPPPVPVYHPNSYAGLRYWKPLNLLTVDQTQIPGFSDDQYTPTLKDWDNVLQFKLATRKEDIGTVVIRYLLDACADVKQRLESVQSAEQYKIDLAQALISPQNDEQTEDLKQFNASAQKPDNPQCLDPEMYDQYSTPSRDQRLFDGLMLTREFYAEALREHRESQFSRAQQNMLKKIFPHPLLTAVQENSMQKPPAAGVLQIQYCSIVVAGQPVDFAEVKRRIFNSEISENPNEDELGRWGGRGTQRSDLALSCPNYGDVQNPYDLKSSEQAAKDQVSDWAKHR